jgi:hypothetical protein
LLHSGNPVVGIGRRAKDGGAGAGFDHEDVL